jgi:hypothetical protein
MCELCSKDGYNGSRLMYYALLKLLPEWAVQILGTKRIQILAAIR